VGEREDVALLALLSLIQVVRRLFGIEMKAFEGGMVSDHTNVFANSFKRAFPGSLLMQCYAHILRKFRIDERREHNGAYRQFVNNMTFLNKIAIEDVRRLHRCRTKVMFLAFAAFVIEAWIAEGEAKLASVFRKSYINDDDFNNWFYCCSGIHGCVPQNNSLERTNLEVKGNSLITGLMKLGRSMTNTFHVEFPKMVYHHSTERIGVTRTYLVLDAEKAVNREAMEYLNVFKAKVDAVKYNEGWLLNSTSALGTEITAERIEQCQKVLAGGKVDGINHTTRWTYFSYVDSLCYVCEEEVESNFEKVKCHVCSCESFWKQTSCPHAVWFQHPKALAIKGYKIPVKRRGRLVKQQKALTLLSKDKSPSNGTVTDPAATSTNVITQLSQLAE
jgi:hypothetical protein